MNYVLPITAVIVGVAGAFVFVVGYVCGVHQVASLSEGWPTMKATAAMGFVLVSIQMWLTWRRKYVLASFPALVLLALCCWVFVPGAAAYAREVEPATVRGGTPSLGAIAAFLIQSNLGLANGAGGIAIRWRSTLHGALVAVIGVIALAGYLVGNSTLYYYYPLVSAGMALHTAALFTLIGVAISIDARR